MVSCERTAEEVSFEWSHHRISSTDSNVRIIFKCLHYLTLRVKGLKDEVFTVLHVASCHQCFMPFLPLYGMERVRQEVQREIRLISVTGLRLDTLKNFLILGSLSTI